MIIEFYRLFMSRLSYWREAGFINIGLNIAHWRNCICILIYYYSELWNCGKCWLHPLYIVYIFIIKMFYGLLSEIKWSYIIFLSTVIDNMVRLTFRWYTRLWLLETPAARPPTRRTLRVRVWLHDAWQSHSPHSDHSVSKQLIRVVAQTSRWGKCRWGYR